MRTSLAALLTLALVGTAHADEPDEPPPAGEPVAAPPPPAVPAAAATAPALPEGVTPIDDPRPVAFVLTGGNRIVARRVGEDPEFFWVLVDGQMARIRKTEIATMDFRGDAAPAPQPVAQPVRDEEWVRALRAQPPPRRGRGMVIWGGILLGVGYSLAIAGAFSDSTADDGSALLLAIPIAGPLLYAGASAERGEVGVWVVDGLLQAAGAVLLYFGIRRLQEPTEPERRQQRRAALLDLSVGPHGGIARATWTF